MPPFARWPLLFPASPACIFYSVSPPAWALRRWWRGFCLRLHAGLRLSSPRWRAFFFPFLLRLGRFDCAGGDFASVCTPASAFLHLAGVHFSSHFSSGLAVSTVTAGILPPCARWPLPFFISLACIFHSVSPPAWVFRRCRRGFCLRLHAGLCLSSSRRRAFFIPFLLRRGRLDDAGGDFASVCTLAPAVPRFAGVHFSSRFSSGLDVSTMPAGNFPLCARWPLPFFASPACIFHSVSPPAWPSRCCRRAICLRVHAGSLLFLASSACIFLPISPPP